MKESKQQISKKEEISKLKDEYKREIETHINDLKRLQAEFENYKKRVDKENYEYREYCNKDVLYELLTVMDDFECSFKGIEIATKQDLDQTLRMVFEKIRVMLEQYKVRPFKSINEKFNPFKHEVLIQEESDSDNIVLEEIQKGYYYKDKILRHAKVKISRQKEVKNDEPNKAGKTG